MYIVSITSQGQFSIPARLRRELGFHKHKKAIVSVDKGKMIVEPASDFMSLKGSLHKYAKKGMPINKIIELEEKAWEKGAVERYVRTLSLRERRKLGSLRKS
ncbi:MAG: hypothetical protein UT19_C0011G0005 [Candidatus Woesebacteria bacterium GW2011_GWB1_39_10b]|uniref:SpoVT-AbrB domain-containing protein n=3 Tax=Candidatus Woeseibacteriota TaxID=1752722 RepID=A0A0G0NE52_9BACT|nr:MAG: hypothetical protein US72_C0012G0038 [Microgenomates group bacterium GW2011_GWC1_38_12]KKQ93460.1 MAG: hypothetical protein UT19_C0011G0005 [Candidatus Woesebacteria bacterium GW2011_GWB1_39_10b]KKR13773.1 MAG: hypothetical protein UT40_C0010G0001 [Candidatus Woesebacteria bacterium GW2011_GWA1_39_21b]OGM65142.1 MAG: hypothetical protein A3A52_04585 [Candidatus Woesebacteria bacterium RIFCSPLOWO2_01_FULL_39_14]